MLNIQLNKKKRDVGMAYTNSERDYVVPLDERKHKRLGT